MPAGYVIAIRERLKDAEEYKTYARMAMQVRGGQKALVAYGRHETLEGTPVEGVVILEFHSYEAAKAWYDSPEYQEAREHRFAGADYQFLIVEGVQESH